MRKRRRQKESAGKEDPIKLPQDVVYGALIVTLTGNTEAYVENYRALLGYTKDKIVIQGKKETITIKGNNFLIQYFTNDDMKITGWIDAIEYCGS